MSTATKKKSEGAHKGVYMTVRDADGEIRAMLDEIRLLEGAGEVLPPDRTEMIRIMCRDRLVSLHGRRR